MTTKPQRKRAHLRYRTMSVVLTDRDHAVIAGRDRRLGDELTPKLRRTLAEMYAPSRKS